MDMCVQRAARDAGAYRDHYGAFSVPRGSVQVHPDGGAVRRVSVHGHHVARWAAGDRPNPHPGHAHQVPARLHVPEVHTTASFSRAHQILKCCS